MKKSRRHALGQHFLNQPSILRKIVRVVDPHRDEVILEVGPGRGALTSLLAAEAGAVIGVERDARLVPILEALALPRTTIVQDDILTADWAGLLARSGAGLTMAKLAGNIPYAISSPLLARLFETRTLFGRIVFLLQKEFALRLVAGPGSKAYGPLSILSQRFFVIKKEFPVAAGAFSPPPRVESEVVSLVPREAPDESVEDEPLLGSFLHACFAQRRKTLANNLEALGLDRGVVLAALEGAGLSPRVRAEAAAPAALIGLFRGFLGSGLDRVLRPGPGTRRGSR